MDREKLRELMSEMLLRQNTLAAMLQILDMIEDHVKAVRQALLEAFGADNDNDEPKGSA